MSRSHGVAMTAAMEFVGDGGLIDHGWVPAALDPLIIGAELGHSEGAMTGLAGGLDKARREERK